MASVANHRQQMFRDISQNLVTAQAALKSGNKNDITAFDSLYQAIQDFIKYSPYAFSDISCGIGAAQDLLLSAAAQFKGGKKHSQLTQWEKRLDIQRLSKEGHTHPNMLRKTDLVGTGVLLTWRPPRLDNGDDSGEESEEDCKVTEYYAHKHCDCFDPPSPVAEREYPSMDQEFTDDFADSL